MVDTAPEESTRHGAMPSADSEATNGATNGPKNGDAQAASAAEPTRTSDGVCREREYPMNGLTDQNPPGMGLWALFREDWATHGNFFAQGLWAVTINRFGNWRMSKNKLVRVLTKHLYLCGYRFLHWTTRIELPYIVKLGRRVRIWHHGGCVLGACSIGDDVQIRHNVTFGLATHGDPIHQLPILEERVIVGAGAAVLGPVRIGHDSIVGANAVVTKDVPPYSLVAGIPARVIRKLDEAPLLTAVKTQV